ncbi:hypothetical protein Hanom_Chr03g00276401 [Helianthus anomalus]
MSLMDTLKVPNFADLDFNIVEDIGDGEVFIKQLASAAYAIRPPVDPVVLVPNPFISESRAEAGGPSIIPGGGCQSSVSSDNCLFWVPSGRCCGGDGNGGCGVTSKGEGKVVSFTGTVLGSSLGPDCFLEDNEDQVSYLPSSWFGPKVMTFFRYADVFSYEIEVDPAMAEDKFVPDWEVKNKDSLIDALTTKMFLFGINIPIDHSWSRRMKSQELGSTVFANQAQSNVHVVELYHRWVEAESQTPDIDMKVAQLSKDLIVHQEKIKSLSAQNQSAQAAAASATEERDKIAVELAGFVATLKENDEAHNEVLAKTEESLTQLRSAYDRMLKGEADLKAKMEVMEKDHRAEVKDLKLEIVDLNKRMDELRSTKVWLLTESAQLLAKHVHKGPEMTQDVATLNNAMSAVELNVGVHGGVRTRFKEENPLW